MKKLIITLLCAMLLCTMLQPAVLAASESIEIELKGRQLNLMFDRSEQFSYVTGSNVQASFYTYLDESNDLYELYMIFPRDVQSGATIDPAYARQHAPETSVVLIVTTAVGVEYYFAGQAESTDASDYTIIFDSVSESDTGLSYSGTLSASMIGMSGQTDSEIAPISIQGARFSFTMPAGNDGDSREDSPMDTLPPDVADEFGDNADAPLATPAPSREVFSV